MGREETRAAKTRTAVQPLTALDFSTAALVAIMGEEGIIAGSSAPPRPYKVRRNAARDRTVRKAMVEDARSDCSVERVLFIGGRLGPLGVGRALPVGTRTSPYRGISVLGWGGGTRCCVAASTARMGCDALVCLERPLARPVCSWLGHGTRWSAAAARG